MQLFAEIRDYQCSIKLAYRASKFIIVSDIRTDGWVTITLFSERYRYFDAKPKIPRVVASECHIQQIYERQWDRSHDPRNQEQSANENFADVVENFPRSVISPATSHGKRSFCPLPFPLSSSDISYPLPSERQNLIYKFICITRTVTFVVTPVFLPIHLLSSRHTLSLNRRQKLQCMTNFYMQHGPKPFFNFISYNNIVQEIDKNLIESYSVIEAVFLAKICAICVNTAQLLSSINRLN